MLESWDPFLWNLHKYIPFKRIKLSVVKEHSISYAYQFASTSSSLGIVIYLRAFNIIANYYPLPMGVLILKFFIDSSGRVICKVGQYTFGCL